MSILFKRDNDFEINQSMFSTVSGSSVESSHSFYTSMCFAVNAYDRKICIVSQEEQRREDSKLFLLEIISEQTMRLFGKRLLDSEIDEDMDDYVHCDQCDSFYSFSCFYHPIYRVLDRPYSGCDESTLRAQRTLPAFLYIFMSSIPDAGKGVFSKVDIPVGIVFGPYEGILRRDLKRAECDGYSWEIRRGATIIYVDGRDTRFSNWMRFINSSRYEGEQNLIAFQYAGGVYYRVFRPIDREKELLVWYGEAYGKALGINTTPKKSFKKKKPKISGKNPYIFE